MVRESKRLALKLNYGEGRKGSPGAGVGLMTPSKLLIRLTVSIYIRRPWVLRHCTRIRPSNPVENICQPLEMVAEHHVDSRTWSCDKGYWPELRKRQESEQHGKTTEYQERERSQSRSWGHGTPRSYSCDLPRLSVGSLVLRSWKTCSTATTSLNICNHVKLSGMECGHDTKTNEKER